MRQQLTHIGSERNAAMESRIIVGEMICHARSDADARIYTEVIDKKVYEKPRLGFGVMPGSRWLDIGANVGAFSMWTASRRATSIAFEPIAENCDVAKKNFAANNLKIDLVEAAVGASNGAAEISYNEKTPARSTLLSGKNSVRSVQVHSFNELVEEHMPDGIKLDAEGAELEIIDAGINLKGVNFFVLEYHARFDKSLEAARQRLLPIASKFRHHRIPKSITSGTGEYPSWIDPICYFWN